MTQRKITAKQQEILDYIKEENFEKRDIRRQFVRSARQFI